LGNKQTAKGRKASNQKTQRGRDGKVLRFRPTPRETREQRRRGKASTSVLDLPRVRVSYNLREESNLGRRGDHRGTHLNQPGSRMFQTDEGWQCGGKDVRKDINRWGELIESCSPLNGQGKGRLVETDREGLTGKNRTAKGEKRKGNQRKRRVNFTDQRHMRERGVHQSLKGKKKKQEDCNQMPIHRQMRSGASRSQKSKKRGAQMKRG